MIYDGETSYGAMGNGNWQKIQLGLSNISSFGCHADRRNRDIPSERNLLYKVKRPIKSERLLNPRGLKSDIKSEELFNSRGLKWDIKSDGLLN